MITIDTLDTALHTFAQLGQAPPVDVDVNRDAATEELIWRTVSVLIVGTLLVLMWNYAPRVLLIALAVGALMLIGSIG